MSRLVRPTGHMLEGDYSMTFLMQFMSATPLSIFQILQLAVPAGPSVRPPLTVTCLCPPAAATLAMVAVILKLTWLRSWTWTIHPLLTIILLRPLKTLGSPQAPAERPLLCLAAAFLAAPMSPTFLVLILLLASMLLQPRMFRFLAIRGAGTLALAQPRSAPRSHLLPLKTCQPHRRLQRHRLFVMVAIGALYATTAVSPLCLASCAILGVRTLAALSRKTLELSWSP